jgi:hypothetical protein
MSQEQICGRPTADPTSEAWDVCRRPRPCPVHGTYRPAPSDTEGTPELGERYEQMPETEWFKEAHEGKSLGEPVEIEPQGTPECGNGCTLDPLA